MKKIIIYITLSLLTFLSVLGQNQDQAVEAWKKGEEIMNKRTAYHIFYPKDVERAIKFYSKSLSYDSLNYKTLCSRGAAYYQLEKYELAYKDLQKAIEVDPSLNVAYYNVGMILDDLGEYRMAIQYYNYSATGIDSLDVDLYHNIGSVYDDMEVYDSAIMFYDVAISINQSLPFLYMNRGFSKMKNGQYNNAISDFNRAIMMDENYLDAYNNRGLTKFYLGLYEAAIIDFNIALGIDLGRIKKNYEAYKPVHKYAVNNKANAYAKLGKYEEACKLWKKSTELGYQYDPSWKRIYGIDDPNELIKLHCE